MKATCTWGEEKNVLLILEPDKGDSLMLYDDPVDKNKAVHGYCRSGSIFLTSDHARELAIQLQQSADQADELERAYALEEKGEKK